MRLFVALVPPAEVVVALPPLPLGIRPVTPDQVHLTLAFLGEQPAATPIAAGLDHVMGGTPPMLWLSGAGAFGNAVWLGLRGDLDRLSALAADVQDAVRATGIELEHRRWRPHLTVGRTRDRRDDRDPRLPPLLAGLAGYSGPSAAWDEVRLIRSRLGSGGGLHEVLTSWRLATLPKEPRN
jgi:2'-5' RNA ligase